jgi:septal ring factor EnvC (AmiA/AmiB activator)
MKWPLVTRRRHERDLDAVNADRERIRGERDQFAKDRDTQRAVARTAARQFAEADTANRRLEARNLELGRRLATLTEADPDYTAALERRLARALKSCARWMDATWVETRHADRLQAQLDDLFGLNSDAIALGETWQDRREKKMRYDA